MIDVMLQDLLLDFTGDDEESLISEEVAERMLERALDVVSSDLLIAYQIVDEGDDPTLVPEMPGVHRELWLLWSKVLVCRFLRARSANLIAFSSGDKRVDRGKETSNWADLEESLLKDYKARIVRINPAADESVLQLGTAPLVYIQGAAVEAEENQTFEGTRENDL